MFKVTKQWWVDEDHKVSKCSTELSLWEGLEQDATARDLLCYDL